MFNEIKNSSDTAVIADELENLRAGLSVSQEQADRLRAHVAELESRLRMARGTEDVSAAARAARPQTLPEAIEARMHERICAAADLVRLIGAPANKVAAVLKELRSQKKICNVGTEDHPRWAWRVGDNAEPEVLNAAVRRLIVDQPLSTAELVDATGARASRVSGALVAIQRSGADILKLPMLERNRFRWFLPETARDARLAPKAKKP